MATTQHKRIQRERRHKRARAKLSGTPERPRLAVFRSNKYMYAQLIDDTNAVTLASASSHGMKGGRSEQATSVGTEIAKAAQKKGVTEVVFDRGGFLYAGQVKALAEAARKEGLTF